MNFDFSIQLLKIQIFWKISGWVIKMPKKKLWRCKKSGWLTWLFYQDIHTKHACKVSCLCHQVKDFSIFRNNLPHYLRRTVICMSRAPVTDLIKMDADWVSLSLVTLCLCSTKRSPSLRQVSPTYSIWHRLQRIAYTTFSDTQGETVLKFKHIVGPNNFIRLPCERASQTTRTRTLSCAFISRRGKSRGTFRNTRY